MHGQVVLGRLLEINNVYKFDDYEYSNWLYNTIDPNCIIFSSTFILVVLLKQITIFGPLYFSSSVQFPHKKHK